MTEEDIEVVNREGGLKRVRVRIRVGEGERR
jgi:hypothetical protein